MTEWHVNEGLQVLIDQTKAKHPDMTVGTIGDKNHHPPSDHIPNKSGRVNAADFMIDKHFSRNDAVDLVTYLEKDSRVKYIIYNRRIWKANTGWKAYDGSDPHTGHVHLSVNDSAYRVTRPWMISREAREVKFQNITGYLPTLQIGDKDNDVTLPGHHVTRAQLMLDYLVPEKINADGVYGQKTAAAVNKLDGGRGGATINEPLWRKLYNIQRHA